MTLIVNTTAACLASVSRHGLARLVGIQMIGTLGNLKGFAIEPYDGLAVGRTETLADRAVADYREDLGRGSGGDFA